MSKTEQARKAFESRLPEKLKARDSSGAYENTEIFISWLDFRDGYKAAYKEREE